MSAAHSDFDPNTTHHHDSAARRQWLIVVGLGLLSLVLGTIGFMHGKGEHAEHTEFLEAVYQSMRLFHMHFDHTAQPVPWQLQVARFLAPFVLGITLVKGFIFVAHGHRRALLHGAQSDHIVICGLGQKGLQLARQCRKENKPVVVIEKDPRNELLRACDEAGVFYWIGDATESAVLARARAAYAKEVVVITPEDETNVRIAMQLRQLTANGRSMRPKCFVHLENIHLRDRLQRVFESDKKPACAFSFFDVYDGEARRILAELPLDGKGMGKDDPSSVHVVIVGFGRMGRSLALRAAKMGHFANGRKLRISVIDRSADRQREHFFFHHPVLQGNSICQLKFHSADGESLTARRLIEGWAADPNTLLHVFVCVDDNARALEIGLRLQEALAGRADCNLCVRFKSRASLADILELAPTATSPRMVAFGMVEDACCEDAFEHEINEDLAKATHEKFVQNRLADSNRTPQTDPALRAWPELTEDLRESNRQQADHLAIKLGAIGCEMAPASDPREAVTTFKREDVELLAELEHTRWNAERWLAGWRYGTPSDKARRINENLVPWNELHDSIQKYDRDSITEIPARLALAKPPLKAVRRNGREQTRR